MRDAAPRGLNVGFVVASEKKEQFLERIAHSKMSTDTITRAKKSIPDFENRVVKRKRL